MKLIWWGKAKDWAWARWTAPQRARLILAAFTRQTERLNGAENALKRVADSIERDLVKAGPDDLTPAQVERLAVLVEECGELMRAAGLVLRYGWGGCSPYGSAPNRVAVEHEAGHVRAALDAMIEARELRGKEVASWRYKRQNYTRKGAQQQ